MALQVTVERRDKGRGGYYAAMFSGFTVCSPDKALARQTLEQKVEQALTGSYDPVLIMPYPGGPMAMVWRDAHSGWEYRIIDPLVFDDRYAAVNGERCPAQPLIGTIIGAENGSRQDCERLARRHLAQYLFNSDYVLGVLGFDDNASMAWIIEHPDDRQQQLDHEAWQADARWAEHDGHPDPWTYANIKRDERYAQMQRVLRGV